MPSDLEEIRRTVTESRAAQGLPPTVEDPIVLGRAADLLRAAEMAAAARKAS